MGAKASTETRVRTYNSGVTDGSVTDTSAHGVIAGRTGHQHHHHHQATRSRPRTRSLGEAMHRAGHPILFAGAGGGSPDSDDSTPEERPRSRSLVGSSMPIQLFSFHGIKCPVCNKFIQPDDIEYHLVMCLTKPKVNYNDDVLTENKGECVICFEELNQGDTIARLPCLCIYHKGCIDEWFKVNRSCPEHPSD